MAFETNVQKFLHVLEHGRGAFWLRWALALAVVAGLGAAWTTLKFNGFSIPEAMDQAQIGRQIASGQGYSTLYARPLALHVMLAKRGTVAMPLRDASEAPLGPIINAAIFKLAGTDFVIPTGRVLAPADFAVAVGGVAFLGGTLALSYLLGRRLYGHGVALLGTGVLLVSELLWRFSISGLPQTAMMFFFTGACLAAVYALDAKTVQRRLALVVTAALLLGVTALGHGIALWLFPGFWLFAVAVIRPRRAVAVLTPLAFFAPLVPWAFNNWRAVRNPLGLPIYDLYRAFGVEKIELLSDFEPLVRFHWSAFLQNTLQQTMEQASGLASYLGGNVVAFAFFIALFAHPYRRWQAAQFRWAILLMWLGAAAGMCIFGVGRTISANQLHVLFVPLMVFYGFDFLLGLWDRLGIETRLLRVAYIVVLYLFVGLPLVFGLLTDTRPVNWPPYLPPVIQQVGQWVGPGEALASDIPWATAWYANRLSLLLPKSIEQFELIHGERLLGGPLVGLYLTPESSRGRTYADIVNGRYREWARFILREVRQEDIQSWVLKSAVNLPPMDECIYFADRPRWQPTR